VATLPKQSKRKRGKGDNSGDYAVPDEVYERHLAKINSTEKAMDKAKIEYDQAKGVHQSAYKAAKGDGCEIDAIRLARKLDKQDHGLTQIIYANVARVLNIMDSPLGSKQLDLFGAIVAATPAPADPGRLGEQAGREAVDAGANPYTPGSDDFVVWADGWARGQQANAEKFQASQTVN
jgi:hypothetical protein